MPSSIKSPNDLSVGEIYEDCFHHPCLCVSVDDDEIQGISLVDGSYPRSCSIEHCGPRKLTIEEARRWKLSGPDDVQLEPQFRWWANVETTLWRIDDHERS
jgi:hypothetical protein